MHMFMGEYHHSIDEKGRLTIPSKIRYELGDNFIITRGLDGCLFIYQKEVWNNIVGKYQALPNIKDTRNFMRFFLSGATETSFDKQGRVNISQTLIEYASLKKDCVIIGVGNRLEVWNYNKWMELMNENEDDFSVISDKLFGGLNA